MALENAVFAQMTAAPDLAVFREDAERIARMVQRPDEMVEALWRYASIGWLRGQRFERARANDEAAQTWGVRALRAVRR